MPFIAQASSMSLRVDRFFLGSLAVCAAFLLLVTFFIVYFSVRYSRKRNPEPEDIEGNTLLEVVWTLVPLVLFLGMFYYGWTDYRYLRNPPADSLVVRVTARQWAWSFEYPNGLKSDVLYAALGRPMRLELRSLDVIHGFYIPAFRLKIDVLPDRDTGTWFLPRLLGDFDIECSVICGLDHSAMLSKARVVSEEDFKAWYFSDESAPKPAKDKTRRPPLREALAGRGAALLRDHGCLSCHSTDGTTMVGPTFKGLFGSGQRVLEGSKARTMKADAAFLAVEILEPGKRVVEGYPEVMPPTPLTPEEADAVVSTLKGLSR